MRTRKGLIPKARISMCLLTLQWHALQDNIKTVSRQVSNPVLQKRSTVDQMTLASLVGGHHNVFND